MSKLVSPSVLTEKRDHDARTLIAPLARPRAASLLQQTADRRRLVQWLAVGGIGSVVLAACGGNNEVGLANEEVTRIAGVPGEPPTRTPAAATSGAGAATDPAPPTAGAPITIEAFDIGWRYNGTETALGSPIEVTAAPGATISLPNTGAAPHNFVAETLDNLVVDMPVGQTVTYTVPADAAPGTYEFICNLPGHAQAGMVGNLVVDPAAGGPAAAPEAATPAGAPAQVATPTGGPITIEAFDIGWRHNGTETAPGSPIEVTAAPGATITLTNTGTAPHNFVAVTLDNLVVDMPVGQTVTYTVPADAAPGTYEFICNLPGHAQAGMVGNLVVDPNAAAAAAATSPVAGQAPAPAPAPSGDAVTIEAYDIGWRFNGEETAPGAPIEVPVSPGATITLSNTGAAPHNFVAETLDNVVVDMPVGQTVTHTIPADAAPGTYEFICNLPGHAPAGMIGNLVIQ